MNQEVLLTLIAVNIISLLIMVFIIIDAQRFNHSKLWTVGKDNRQLIYKKRLRLVKIFYFACLITIAIASYIFALGL